MTKKGFLQNSNKEAFSLKRRELLRGAMITGATAYVPISLATPVSAKTKMQPSVPVFESADGEQTPLPTNSKIATDEKPSQIWGSDYMVDVLRGLGIDTVAMNPGSTFNGLHESVVNHAMVTEPRMDLITATHEEISVAFAHGYAKVTGKPMCAMLHSTVGLQHASMAIYNAWCDRVPVFLIVGAKLDSARRGYAVEWLHAVNDGAALVRDFLKWDDQPISLINYSESAVRAYKFSTTPPYGPVLLAVPAFLQKDPVAPDKVPDIPPLPTTTAPAGEPTAVKKAAEMIVAAEYPVIVADRLARTARGMDLLVELAELLQAPVIDAGGRMNFPWRHPLNQTFAQNDALAQTDLLLGLELTDFWGISKDRIPDTAKRISITTLDYYMKSNYQNFQRFTSVDLAIAADGEATLPSLIEHIRYLLSREKGNTRKKRGLELAADHKDALMRSREAAAVGWDNKPITTARLCAELYDKIREEDWALVSGTIFQQHWPQQLWDAKKHYQYMGDSGAYGLGYLPGASIGAAYAHKRAGRLPVAIGGDGDLMYAPGALWSAAHHKIPLLYIIHNNGGYHQETMLIQWTGVLRNRGMDRGQIGNVLTEPNIDFAALARSLGVHAEGPVTDPADLGPAIARAISIVKQGRPALIDVVAEGR